MIFYRSDPGSFLTGRCPLIFYGPERCNNDALGPLPSLGIANDLLHSGDLGARAYAGEEVAKVLMKADWRRPRPKL